MSQRPFSRSPDLGRLREQGFFVQIQGGFLVMREVPYLAPGGGVRTGTLISTLTLADDVTRRPDTHVIYFDGEFPHRADGTPIPGIAHQSGAFDLGGGLTAQHMFSSKPAAGYADYYEKMTTYASILAGPAATRQPGATPRVFRAPDTEDESVFEYIETASDRAGIGALTDRLRGQTVAIIGLGGTGSYVLDLVAKTPAREIRLFDADEFLQHNAFRAPGAPSRDELRCVPKKVDYLAVIYARMHRHIVPHAVDMGPDTVDRLEGVTSAFLCMDAGEAKRHAITKLEALGATFVDVGMGLELVDGSLGGILRVTASTPAARAHVHAGRVGFAGGGGNDVYASNIQVADLNALNAALAVIKWKKLLGFYRDLEGELHSTYTTDGNLLLNEEVP